MLTVETRQAVHPDFARAMDTATLRRHFLADGMFADGEVRLIYTHYDRFVMGAAVPAGGALVLDRVAEAGTPSFLDRREMGIVNIGDAGTVSAA
ncbi:MAG: 5-dehydro-4-deoxy-D-glucuronate isomerase, partial [Rhodobacteraceae bacterium]|nr:5-dehydro-4-deoxy-D-glucuronate isomerase [Paracoccaceae bacterium]